MPDMAPVNLRGDGRPSAIHWDPERRILLLCTPNTAYAAQVVGDQDALVHGYWGARITPAEAGEIASSIAAFLSTHISGFDAVFGAREEYPVDGGIRFGQPALAARFAGDVRSIEWRFVGCRNTVEAGVHDLVLEFEDRHFPLGVALHYRVHDGSDVIERWSTVTNKSGGSEGIRLSRMDSAAWAMPAWDQYRLSHLVGRWGAETQLRTAILTEGETVLTSRRGITSHHANPWFAVDDGTATEERGDVYSGALAWSGSWRIVAQLLTEMPLQLIGGLGHEDFGPYELAPGQTFRTPVFAGVYSADGFGGASRAWHAYQLAHVLPHAEQLRPVLYNSWEATGFDVNEENQLALAERAAKLGVELFVVDDGWFSTRTSDRSGLGDWQVNTERFPNGLKPVIERVHRLGMQFGIWVEPEMVNADSDLYRAHPDWVYHFPERTRSELRNQLVLNLARPDVAQWVYEQVHQLLADHDIQFVKWDMNRPFTEAGWPAEADNPRRLWIDHVRNLYGILDRLRADHPGVAFESCSGGGGRIDLGVLSRVDQVWTSDNTDGPDRRIIQHGFSQLYPARVMSCWVTDVPDLINRRSVPLRYRFHVAMAGVLGIGGDLSRWTDEELAEAGDLIAQYKRIRPIVQHGRLFRLGPPSRDVSAVQYVTRVGAESVLLCYLGGQRFGGLARPVRLRGLDPAANYRLDPGGQVVSGAVLLRYGLHLDLVGDYDSTLIHLVRQ